MGWDIGLESSPYNHEVQRDPPMVKCFPWTSLKVYNYVNVGFSLFFFLSKVHILPSSITTLEDWYY